MKKCYSMRLFPSSDQISQLKELSEIRKDIWNKLLDIEQNEYKTNKSIFNKFDLNNMLPSLKEQYPHWKKLNAKAIQTIATELYGSYRSFFNLIKKDKTSRPPKKNENDHYHTIVWNQSGWLIKDNIITINKIPFKFKSKIDITRLDIKEIKIKYVRKKWLCDIIIEEPVKYQDNLKIKTKVLAIDLGLTKLATCVDNKGEVIILKNKSKKINDYYQKQISKIQNKRSRTTKNSKRNKKLRLTLNKCYHKKNEQIKQTLHVQSKKLVNMNYNTIVVGDLNVKNLMSTEGVNENKKNIRKSFHKSNINMFLQFLGYKCQANNVNLTKIDEKWTTQLNSLTGTQFKTKISLGDRQVQLSETIIIDRDINSAINIMKRWFGNHVASMNEPLDFSRVLVDNNLYKETTTSLVS
jgi:putative transposase